MTQTEARPEEREDVIAVGPLAVAIALPDPRCVPHDFLSRLTAEVQAMGGSIAIAGRTVVIDPNLEPLFPEKPDQHA